MLAAVYFWMDELMPVVQQFQTDTSGNPMFMQLDRTIPLQYEDFTEQEEEYIKQFLCNNTRMYYHESLYKDYIGTVPYTLDFNYDWNCDIMPWATDKIRIYYRAGLLNERVMGKKLDSRNPVATGRLAEANNK